MFEKIVSASGCTIACNIECFYNCTHFFLSCEYYSQTLMARTGRAINNGFDRYPDRQYSEI